MKPDRQWNVVNQYVSNTYKYWSEIVKLTSPTIIELWLLCRCHVVITVGDATLPASVLERLEGRAWFFTALNNSDAIE